MHPNLPRVVSPAAWHAARVRLLAEEKALTKARDALNVKRRELPMVRVDEDYAFTGCDGARSLADLFHGRRQLIVQHFMFDPAWDAGCPSCSAAASEISAGLLEHLHARDTTLVVVSRAPIDRIEAYRASKGWTFPWYSSFGSGFNYDYQATLDARVAPIEYNFRDAAELERAGLVLGPDESSEQPGYSVFLTDDGSIFHTYSMYARGTEQLGGSYYFLDITALGRQEDWEEPKGRADLVRGPVPNFAT